MTTATAPLTSARPPVSPLPGRRLAVAGLLIGATLNTAEAVLGQFLPPRPEGLEDQLRGVAENTALYGVRAVLGTLAVPFMLIGFLAAARLLAAHARRTGLVAGTLLAAGMWGFLGVHVIGLLQLPLAGSGDLAAAAGVLTDAQASPVLGVLFMLPFLAGCVAGMLTLTIGMLATGAAPRWVAASWLLFIVLDFSVGAVGPVDPHWLFLAGAVGLVLHLTRRGDAGADEA